MPDYTMELDGDIYPSPSYCLHWARSESCGRTTCAECGEDAAAVLVANARASLTGVVVAARQLAQEGDDPHDVMSRCLRNFLDARCARMALSQRCTTWTWWFSGLWEAAANIPASDVPRAWAIEYSLGRLAYVAWRNAREENRRV